MLTEEGQGKDGLTERWYDSDWRDWETKHFVSTPSPPTTHSEIRTLELLYREGNICFTTPFYSHKIFISCKSYPILKIVKKKLYQKNYCASQEIQWRKLTNSTVLSDSLTNKHFKTNVLYIQVM